MPSAQESKAGDFQRQVQARAVVQASLEILQHMTALCVASHHRNMPNDLLLMAIAAFADMTRQ